MKPFIFIVISTLICPTCYCQKAIIREISAVNPISKEKYVFPLVSIRGNDKASQQINRILCREVLGIDHCGPVKSIFENVWKTNDTNFHWVYTNFSYNILVNTGRLLCLSISFEGGKHNQDQTRYFTFNNKTGDQLTFDNMLSGPGKKMLIDSVNVAKTSLIKKEIRSLNDSLRRHVERQSIEQQRDSDAIALYNRCLERGRLTDLEHVNFYVKNETLFVKVGQCAPWAENALDDLGDFLFPFSLEYLQPYFTDFSRPVFVTTK